MAIDEDKASELHRHLISGGSAKVEDVAAFLECTAAESKAYLLELKSLHPEVYGGKIKADEDPKPAKKRARAKKVAKTATTLSDKKIVLMNPDGTTTQLEVVRETERGLALREYVEPDTVDLLIKGEVVEVDLGPIRQEPSEKVIAPYGMTAAMLLALGAVARGE